MELWNLWWPVGLVVLADVFYQICARRLSSLKSPLAALGMTYLFSLNRARADADVVLASTGGRSLACFGRVMLPHRLPVPQL